MRPEHVPVAAPSAGSYTYPRKSAAAAAHRHLQIPKEPEACTFLAEAESLVPVALG